MHHHVADGFWMAGRAVASGLGFSAAVLEVAVMLLVAWSIENLKHISKREPATMVTGISSLPIRCAWRA